MKDRVFKKIDESLIHHYAEADREIIEDELKENIMDPSGYATRRDELTKRITFLANAVVNKNKDSKLLVAAEKFFKGIEADIEKPIAMLRKIISENPSLTYYSNLKKLSKEDIVEIIKDKNFISLLEQLEKDENQNERPSGS